MTFYKYHGTGNDFVLIDDREGSCVLSVAQVAALCHRRYGIGADGLMLLRSEAGFDFRMVYYNADGSESTMCGNGGRCMVAFARHLGIVGDTANFMAIDGSHTASVHADGHISLQMKDVRDMDIQDGYTVLDTGSPHRVVWVKDAAATDVVATGRAIRNYAEYQPGGINVNFTQCLGDHLYVRTYERGVEDETLSCGTGVTAAAIAATCRSTGAFDTRVLTPGGELRVSFMKTAPESATGVVLTGPAVMVYKGEIDGI